MPSTMLPIIPTLAAFATFLTVLLCAFLLVVPSSMRLANSLLGLFLLATAVDISGWFIGQWWAASADGYIPALRVQMAPVPRDQFEMGELEGAYYSDTLQQAVVIFEQDEELWLRTDDGLRTSPERYQPATLRPIEQSAVQRIGFVRNDSGPVTHALVSSSLADKIEYQKIAASPIN